MLSVTDIYIKGNLQNGLDIDGVISLLGRYWYRIGVSVQELIPAVSRNPDMLPQDETSHLYIYIC
jgi:hypothetical protein